MLHGCFDGSRYQIEIYLDLEKVMTLISDIIRT